MALANTLKGVSAKILKKFGNDAILRKITIGAYDPTTGKTSDIIEDSPIKLVEEDSQKEYTSAGDSIVTLVSSVEINESDKIVYKDKERDIINVIDVSMQNVNIIYQLAISGDATKRA